MATSHYNFPTINGTDTIDGVNAINGLANSVDSALFGVAGSIPQEYTLPVAGTTTLGGVRGSGDISVNASTGDMTINNNTVTSAKLQDASIMGSKIATGAVGTAQLASNVLTDINQGVSAYTSNTSAPRLYTFDALQPSGKMTAGTIYSHYVVSEACNIATAKLTLAGCAFNLSGGNTGSSNQLATVGTIPAQYRPSVNQDALCYVVGGTTLTGVCLFYATVNESGQLGIYHVNYTKDAISQTESIYASVNLVWYYGDQRQN